MNSIKEVFLAQKEKAKSIQKKLLEFLSKGETAGLKIDPVLFRKIEESISDAGKLKIALIGGFSEGKTSIAAAWLGKVKEDMKISHQESSNSVAIYELDDDLVLIDTPGLFGYKETFNADIGEQEKYKDITRKYVSEAHLVLYVMNSSNPLKESHKSELNWLFRDLNLLPRTVFVLSRFDEIADVEDEGDYERNFIIKKNNVISRMKDLINLSSEESQDLSIVAVSANPFDLGFEYWQENKDRFTQLSHIYKLQKETIRKIQLNDGVEKLALESSKSIIRDILNREIPIAVEKDESLIEQSEKLTKNLDRAEKELNKLKKRIDSSQISLREFTLNHFTDLILQLDGTSIETISEFFEREIGNEGIVLETRIQNIFNRNIDAVANELIRIQNSLNSDTQAFNAHLISMGKEGLNWLAKSNLINATNIKATRDILWSSFKFKPWGAVNLAKNLNKGLAIIGIAVEVWDWYNEKQRESKFIEAKSKFKNNLEEQRKEILGKINSEDFAKTFFPGYEKIIEQINRLEEELQKTREQRKFFANWRLEAETLDAEFEEIKN